MGCPSYMSSFEYADPEKGEKITCPSCLGYFTEYEQDEMNDMPETRSELIEVTATCGKCLKMLTASTQAELSELMRQHTIKGCEDDE